ncbi:MAG: putative toxin-antitoxin system toxin component, PIN family [Candidatus Atribacteria bacterium]|nr:MAG: putative toxin-antitoxin system toxin component, PIN family [Candidatus Atribacteria bacterium]
MEKLKIFLDSNVLIAGLYSEKGGPGIILDHFIAGKIGIIISQKVLNEVIEVLSEKLQKMIPFLQEFLLSYPPEIIKDAKPENIKKWSGLVNEDDAMILESAMSCQPDYFITGDKPFFSSPLIEKRSDLKILRPESFADILKKI